MFQSRRVQRASRPIELYGFEDEDFSKYPCIKIPETNYTIDEYETIANNLLRMLASDDSQVFSEAARGLAVLAYNTLMDPLHWNETNSRPFFHKHNETEPWIRYRDEPAIDLGQILTARQGDGPSLRLVKPSASVLERKSSIGSWAFLHLRAFGHIPLQALQKSFIEFHDRRKFMEGYGYSSAYEIPVLSGSAYSSLKNEYKNQRNTEILYLFFRAAIILERNYENRNFRNLLEETAFGGYHGLRYGGLWLWHDFRNASRKNVMISMASLYDCIDLAIADSSSIADSDRLRAVVSIFRQFYLEYVMRPLPMDNWTQKSRYYMYAHVVDNNYFYWIGSRDFLELSYALQRISDRPNLRPPPSPYKEWGEAIVDGFHRNFNKEWEFLLQNLVET